MASYKIYTGIVGSDLQFQYVKHNCNQDEALDKARELAIEQFENSEHFPEHWDECISQAEWEINEEDLEEYNEELYRRAEELYLRDIDSQIKYEVLLYEE